MSQQGAVPHLLHIGVRAPSMVPPWTPKPISMPRRSFSILISHLEPRVPISVGPKAYHFAAFAPIFDLARRSHSLIDVDESYYLFLDFGTAAFPAGFFR